MTNINAKYIYVDSIQAIEAVIDNLLVANVLGIDTETTGLNPHDDKLRLIQIAVDNMPTVIIDFFYVNHQALEMLKPVFCSTAVKVFQNAKFDLQFLKSVGFIISGPIFDTMLASQILRTSGGPRRAGLGVLAEFYLGIDLPKDEQKSDFSQDLTKSQLQYAARDASILLVLRKKMIEDIKKNHLVEVARLEFSCAYAIADMEYNGIHLNLDKWGNLAKAFEIKKVKALNALYPYTGYPVTQMSFLGEDKIISYNLDSHKKVLALLEKNGINVENTSRHSLLPYKDTPIVKALLQYRHASKALSSFLHSIPNIINKHTKRLHPHYGQIGAWSGRMSCGGPNIQQIPRDKEFRSCFTAPKGRKLVVADYSQIELRVIAQISKDERMIEAYRNGEDLHSLTASLISGKKVSEITKKERQAAKAVNFGLVFGMGAAGLKSYSYDTYGVNMTLKEAIKFKDRFFQGYKGVDAWHNKIKRDSPSISRTLAGRIHTYTENTGVSGRFNTPVQGTAADILKNALGILHNRLQNTNTYIVAVVHDEIVLECDGKDASLTARILKETMEQAGRDYIKDLPVVAECSIGDSWAEK